MIRDLVARAESLARGKAWGKAAIHYARAASAAMEIDELEVARRAWGAAGEAWRRDDDLSNAAKALRMALSLPTGDAESAALDRIRLAGVLGELGNPDAAQQLCHDALQTVPAPSRVREMVLDSTIGVLLGYPDKEAARPLVDQLSSADGDSRFAGVFRRGQLARLDGDLDAALDCFEEVATAFAGRSEAAAGVAAARSEQAEVHLLRGYTAPAVEAYEIGMALHREAGRRALMYRSEAGRVRAMSEAGIWALTDTLDLGISFAIDRGMALLETDLRIARGMAAADSDMASARLDFDVAVSIAERCLSGLRAGRARYEAAIRATTSDARRWTLLCAAEDDLGSSAPLLARVRAAKQRMDRGEGPR